MSTYERYPEYKKSPNSWIGSIPTHWNIMRADFLVQTNRRQVSAESLNGLELIHYSIPNVQEFGTGKLEDGDRIDSAKLLISEQQLLVSKLNPRKSTLCIAAPDDQYTVVASSEFVPLIAGKTHLDYSYYVWGSDKVNKLLSSMVQSVTRSHQRVNPSDVLKIYWAWPPSHEQKAIAQFLDHKTAQIDALIAKKQSLLDKLAEQRGSLISQAVTKGLNDAVPMKKSDVAWLGEIPRHWETKRLRFLMTMSGGLTPRTSEPRYWGGDIPWVSPKDMKSERLSSSIDTLTEDALNETTLRLYPPGKVLIVVRGMILAHTFPVAVNEVPVTVNQDMKVLETTMNPEYLAVLLRGIQSLVLSIVEESAHGTKVLRTDLLKNMVLPVPPRVEQDEIVSEVGRISSRIDKMVSTVTAAITKLQEYRSALITNAVTGKIDVRDFCIPTTTEQREVAHG
ncbi:restriction endonuclease subunit S [Idiomarina sp.]|uniref:restriction endonuclease subunit S n=1 Tax=Idiomarina sp. TaxID=1874361 RepID=UPI0025B93178|nr:restriction endonuclease subunit S [Idiomarina sp.]